jgi:hypothetical protein
MEVAAKTTLCKLDQTLLTLAAVVVAAPLTGVRRVALVALEGAALEQVPIEQTQQPAVQT